MIYDSFMFFNDLDMLEIRLEEHWDLVDKFILTEAPTTQSCRIKPLHYNDNKERFEKYSEKIIHVMMDGGQFSTRRPFYNERVQRNYFLSVGLEFKDDDVFILSDSDEILDSSMVRSLDLLEKVKDTDVIQLDLNLHHYYVNFVIEKFVWTGALITTGALLRRHTPSTMRSWLNYIGIKKELSNNCGPKILKGINIDVGIRMKDIGWHFSWMGGMEKIYYKLNSVCNKAYIVDNYESKMSFQERIENRVTFDFHTDGYKLTLNDNVKLPKYLSDNREKFSHLFYKGGDT